MGLWIVSFDRWPWQNRLGFLDRLSFDTLQLGGNPDQLSSALDHKLWIVEMDLRSYQELDQDPVNTVFDRRLHARLLRKLTADNASLVVFDVVFSVLRDPVVDRELAAAMHAHGNVVLATSHQLLNGDLVGVRPDILPELFKTNAAGIGLSAVPHQDWTVRRHFVDPPGLDRRLESLPTVAARKIFADLTLVVPGESRWMNFYGPSE